jgi:hypothetical protein
MWQWYCPFDDSLAITSMLLSLLVTRRRDAGELVE